jgi:hypothetical protein
MADKGKKAVIRLELTEAQKQEIRKATGKKAEALELTAEELEDRIAPAGIKLSLK